MINLSKLKCVKCGKPAKYRSYFKAHASPLCRECAEKEAQDLSKKENRTGTDLWDYYCVLIENPYPGTEMMGLENVENIKEIISDEKC